ncbi:MAG TPA: hypothetical protein VFP72_12445, partial [Kineosporiaceae bacterium]|nr:hypothetical protein [Kineosporiaceae bacterium]
RPRRPSGRSPRRPRPAPTLMRRLAEEVGESTVQKIVVRGPSAPSWRRGPRVAPGSQGPRDTYG